MRNGWTINTALKYILDLRAADIQLNSQRFEAQERAVEAALYAARTATEKAEAAAEKRFEGVNEFRDQLRDQQGTFITRVESKAMFDNQSSKIETMVSNESAYVTRVEMFSWVGVAAIVGGVIGHFIK